jgi:hypothetical protein
MRGLLLVLLVACGGGGGGEAAGDPLIQSSLMGQFNNAEWTPAFGFGRTETKSGSTSFMMYVGSAKISCADDFEDPPPAGTYAFTSVPTPPTMSTTNSTFVLAKVVGDETDFEAPLPGTVTVTAVTETQVSAVFGYDQTLDGGRYAVNGAVTRLRCP